MDIQQNKDYIIEKNPDKELFDEISVAIKDNDNYCCCAIVKEEDTKCMCKGFREFEGTGFCHCGRYVKIKKTATIAIISSIEDSDRAEQIADSLTAQGFITLTPRYGDVMNYLEHKSTFDELQKVKIHSADLVFVVNPNVDTMIFLEELIYWAEELKKKIIYEYEPEKRDESREFESI